MTGEDWVGTLIANLRYIMFFSGMLMCIVTPFYFFKILRGRRSGLEDMGKPFIMGMFGVAFLIAGLLWNT